jgi:hypothetical protein
MKSQAENKSTELFTRDLADSGEWPPIAGGPSPRGLVIVSPCAIRTNLDLPEEA